MTTSKFKVFFYNSSHLVTLALIFLSRYNYDKKTGEMFAADDDHPLKSSDFSFSNLTMSENNSDQITAELTSVAVDWKPFRSTTSCSCSTPFDQINPKVSLVKKKLLPLKLIILIISFNLCSLFASVVTESLSTMWRSILCPMHRSKDCIAWSC